MTYLDLHDPVTVSFWTTFGKVWNEYFIVFSRQPAEKETPLVLEREKENGKIILKSETEKNIFE